MFLVFLFALMVFCLNYNLITNKDESVDLYKFIIDIVVAYYVSIAMHEGAHFMAAKYYGYKLLVLRTLGLQILIGDSKKIKIDFRPQWFFGANVLFDFMEPIDSEQEMERFFHRYKRIICAGPCCSVLILLISAIMYSGNVLSIICWKELILVNSMILMSGYVSGKTEVNDLDLFFRFEKYKEFLFLWLCLNKGRQKESVYILNEKKLKAHKVAKGNYIDVYENIYLCNYLWTMYETKEWDIKLLQQLNNKYSEYTYENKYYYYTLLCILVLCNDQIGLQRKFEIFEYIYENDIVVYVLKQNTSGVSYFVSEMENVMFKRKKGIDNKLYRLARRRIGLDL